MTSSFSAPLRVLLKSVPVLGIAFGLAIATAVAQESAPSASSDAARWAAERTVFRDAWSSAARGDVQALRQAIAALSGYPLAPYLEFELRRQRIGDYDADSMSRFLARYRDWSFHDRLEATWQRHLARSGRFDVLARYAPDSDHPEVQCRVLRDRLDRGETDGLVDAVRPLWLSAVSQPGVCDPLFSWWRRQGQPTVDDAWTRLGLAIDAGEYGLAGYLRRYLDPADRPFADGWLRMARRPSRGLSDALGWPDQPRARQLVAWGLYRLASRDWQSATVWRERFDGRMRFTGEEIDRVDRRIALFRAVDLDPGAIAMIDALPDEQRDLQMLEWRLRVALMIGNWTAVLDSIDAMPAENQLDTRWRYWRARALDALGRPEAGPAFDRLAKAADYYGFLAALRAGQPLALCPTELRADGALQLRLLRDAEFERALELYRVGRVFDARWTWNRVTERLRTAELEQAALLAAASGWHDRAIVTLARADARTAYPWRFPLMERERIEQHASRHGVDPALVLGLMRAESAMQPDARSPAGARGLLQLMDGTARATARQFGLPYSGPRDLYDAARNIALGVAHLGELARRFGGDLTRVAAAYNAGPSAAERWQQRQGLPTDIWIETLPFFETRDYVPRVLAFATVYEWQLGRSPDLLARHVLGQPRPGTAFACPDQGDDRRVSAAADPLSAQ